MEIKQLTDVIRSNQSLDMTEQEYRDYNAINYSTLSALDRDPALVNKEIQETESMMLGSIVDNLLTQGSYGDQYSVSSAEKPSGQMGEFCDYIIDGYTEEGAFEAVGSKRLKLDTMVVKHHSEGGADYCRMVLDAKESGKKLVSMDIISRATVLSEALKNSPYTQAFFRKDIALNREIEILYQVPIVFNLGSEGTPEGKALIDVVVIDHEKKEITPYDLKTTSGSGSQFRSAFIKWRYYLQASLYHYGLSRVVDSDYTVKPFEFIVASTTESPCCPIIYKCTNKDLHVGRFGGTSPSGYKTKGWEELIDELEWHTRNDLWEYSFEFYQEGFIKLDTFAGYE